LTAIKFVWAEAHTTVNTMPLALFITTQNS
jgi:hypothetical protein